MVHRINEDFQLRKKETNLYYNQIQRQIKSKDKSNLTLEEIFLIKKFNI